MSSLSKKCRFATVDWERVPESPGVYVIYDKSECIYVGMSGRDGGGNLRKRLKDHRSGQMVNMFALYLFLDRVQFLHQPPIRHPKRGKQVVQEYIDAHCSFRWIATGTGSEARLLEKAKKKSLRPTLNPT
jgi:excinuclease UvrABC nuclease subunit